MDIQLYSLASLNDVFTSGSEIKLSSIYIVLKKISCQMLRCDLNTKLQFCCGLIFLFENNNNIYMVIKQQ